MSHPVVIIIDPSVVRMEAAERGVRVRSATILLYVDYIQVSVMHELTKLPVWRVFSGTVKLSS